MNILVRKAAIPTVIIVVAGLVAGVMIATKQAPEKKQVAVKAFLVEAIAARLEDIHFTVKSQGTVEADIKTVLSAQVSGRIERVAEAFTAGGMVKKDQVLVWLEAADYLTDLKVAEAEMARAKAALEQELARGEVAKEEWSTVNTTVAPALGLRKPQLAQEQANVRAAEANFERAKRNLARTEIRAPYDALVKSQDVDLGQFVVVGQPLAMLFSTDVAKVRMPLTDNDLAYLALPDGRNGQAKVTLSAHIAGKMVRWHGQLARHEGVFDNQSRVIYAIAKIQDPYLRLANAAGTTLKFGRFVQAEISGNKERNLVVLPRNVLRLDGSVLIVDEQRKLQIRHVQVLRTDENFIYVNAGIRQGELVTVSSVPNPYNGMPVRLATDVPARQDSAKDNSVIAAHGGLGE